VGRRDDPIEELRAELRELVGGEFRRNAEDDEAAAEHIRLRNRGLADVAFELLSRGDTLQINMGSERFVGVLVHAQGTLATLETQDGDHVHVNLAGPVALRVTRRATSGGRGREELGPDSFVARLRQLQMDGGMLIVGLPGLGESLRCTIDAVADDHLMVTDLTEQTWFLPYREIATVTVRG
jgi:hypothetical protein